MAKTTPADMIGALRLMRKNADWLLEPGDDDEVKATVQGIVSQFVSARRAGETELEFREWYETADIAAMVDEDEGPDPTE